MLKFDGYDENEVIRKQHNLTSAQFLATCLLAKIMLKRNYQKLVYANIITTKLTYATKTKESVTSQKRGCRDFRRIASSVLNKGKSAIPPLFNGSEMFSSASSKAKLFAKNFSKNSNLDDSGISLPVFPSRTNLKLHKISVTSKMVKRVITNLDSSKASSPDCLPVLVLKNCEPELSHIVADFFNMCLKETCFSDCWKVSSVVPVFNLHMREIFSQRYCMKWVPQGPQKKMLN